MKEHQDACERGTLEKSAVVEDAWEKHHPIHKPTPRHMCTLLWSHTQVHVHVNCSVRVKSGSRWSCSAGSHLSQSLFCTESSMRGISVIKSRRSLTTEIIKSSFNCMCKTHKKTTLHQ